MVILTSDRTSSASFLTIWKDHAMSKAASDKAYVCKQISGVRNVAVLGNKGGISSDRSPWFQLEMLERRLHKTVPACCEIKCHHSHLSTCKDN